MISSKVKTLRGTAKVPGDKSISHRALILGALAVGETLITGLLESEDVLGTQAAVNAFGAQAGPQAGPEAGPEAGRQADGAWRVIGLGVGGLREPGDVLDMGNSGTAVRLLMGVAATHPFVTTFSGDASLSARPMERVMGPLKQMGAQFTARTGGCLPITVTGTADPVPIVYELPVASAQVKTAVLLAGLNTPGKTTVIEPEPTRDHTERMLVHFGAEVVVEERPDTGKHITLSGQPELTAKEIFVPGDISSAAFPIVAGLLVPGSAVTLSGVGVNPLRTGLIDTLREMGAAIRLENERLQGGEPVADIAVQTSALRGISVPAARAPSMIDEYPVLAVAAACATGVTRLQGLAELRVKESDRLAAMAKGLTDCGVTVEETQDTLTIHGLGGKVLVPGGATINANLDHRIAMAFLVLGMVAENPVTIDDGATMDTSFPGFQDLMNGLGAAISSSQS